MGKNGVANHIYALGKYTDLSNKDQNGKFTEKKIMVEFRNYEVITNMEADFGRTMESHLKKLFEFDV